MYGCRSEGVGHCQALGLGLEQCDYCKWYEQGNGLPHYPVPAIPLQVKYDYVGCVNIDDVTDPEDPVIVYMYDSWDQIEITQTGGVFH